MAAARTFFAVVGALLLGGLEAAADGKFFSAADDVREPNQKALLWVENGRETLILQVKYEGGTGDFGWVVPVPSRPKMDTAPTELFYELAVVTRPKLVMRAGAREGAIVGGTPGVTVVERAQVGPYDATVLAATDPEALAGWLREHAYKMPEGSAEVLRSYTDWGWYYVALRIGTKRLREELLAELSEIEPEIESVEDAPDRVAAALVRAADEADPAGRAKVGALANILYSAPRVPPEGALSYPSRTDEGRVRWQEMWLRRYERVLEQGDPVERGVVKVRDLKHCLDICADMHGEAKLLHMARAAGFDEVASVDAFVEGVAAEANRDIREGVPYRQSAWRRWHEFLSAVWNTEVVNPAYEQDYRALLAELARYHTMPLPEPPTSREGYKHASKEPLAGSAIRYVLNALATRSRLYHEVQAALSEAVTAVQKALKSGSIEPLRLDFDSGALVYPLYITSLGGGKTDIQLYVLSEHRMVAGEGRGSYQRRFTTSFAGKLDAETLKGAPTLAEFAGDGRSFLTELRAELAAEEMTEDVAFARAPTDAPYREEVTMEELARRRAGAGSGLTPRGRGAAGGDALGRMIGTKELVLLGILAAGAVIVIVNRLRRRASRSS